MRSTLRASLVFPVFPERRDILDFLEITEDRVSLGTMVCLVPLVLLAYPVCLEFLEQRESTEEPDHSVWLEGQSRCFEICEYI